MKRKNLSDNSLKICFPFLATGWKIGVLGFDSRRGLSIFLFTTLSRTVLGPTQPPMQWIRGAISLGGKSGRGVKPTTHLNLMPRSMRGAIPPLPNTLSWRGA